MYHCELSLPNEKHIYYKWRLQYIKTAKINSEMKSLNEYGAKK